MKVSVVMGSVSGFIHAGAHGNKNAYVVAGNLNPKVLQIAGNIAEAPDDENYEENKSIIYRRYRSDNRTFFLQRFSG